VPNDGDCDSGDPNVNPDATEVCNNIDDNCDTVTDEGFNDLCQRVITLQAIGDTYANSNSPETNYKEGYLRTGNKDNFGRNAELLAYVKFDISAIPGNATIVEATLQMTSLLHIPGFEGTTWVYQVSGEDWTENTLNYNNMATEEVQFVSKYSTSYMHETLEWDLKSFVDSWIGGADNFGIKVDTTPTSTQTGATFYSRESSYVPTLTIVYE
jgi:hypothetical protein